MPSIKCEIHCHSNISHLQQVYTGFRMLEQQGKVKLSYRILGRVPPGPPWSALSRPARLLVRVDQAGWLLFDMADSGEMGNEDLDPEDFCFKRSFSESTIGPLLAHKKIFPYGLNYEIYERHPSWFSVRRLVLAKTPKELAGSVIKTLGLLNLSPSRFYRLHIGNGQAQPDPSLPPGVIFMTRLWDPSKFDKPQRDAIDAINLMRAACVRKLKKAFGHRFMGGLLPDGYSSRHFAAEMVAEGRLCDMGRYIRLLRRYPIGVATTGLWNSIGFKFAEYMAFSRAIVSEKLHYEAPGLEAGRHYLEFATADECVTAVSTLMDDRQLCHQMMERNHQYYEAYLRPDKLVWNALAIILAGDEAVRIR
jgi:hypothetical protein